MIFSKLKIYALAAVAAVIAALGATLKIRTAQYKKEKKRATAATERADHAVKVITHDNTFNEQEDERLRDAVNEIEEDGAADVLLDPNSGWVRNGEDDT